MKWNIITDSSCDIFELEEKYDNIEFSSVPFTISVGEENFVDDPLRLLRVYRFQSLYNFSIAPETLSAICKYVELIKKPAFERINYEVLRLFS